jgi:hypothetical protein
MKHRLAIILFFLIPVLMSVGNEVSRVRKYLADHGVSNAVCWVDFSLRSDGDARGLYIDAWAYTNIAKPTLEECPSDAESDAWVSEQWQRDKPYMLKVLENNYYNFLTNDWTVALRTNGLISSNRTICVTNTDETANIIYLIQLKAVNKAEYYNMAGEFDRYKTAIVLYGGIMSQVIKHPEVP